MRHTKPAKDLHPGDRLITYLNRTVVVLAVDHHGDAVRVEGHFGFEPSKASYTAFMSASTLVEVIE